MKIFSPILKGTTTVAQGTTNLSGSFTGSLFGTAATASYADNFTVGGTLTAQTINVQIITSSIEFNTGSTRNGALSSNTHQFTGSVLMSGSVGIGTSTPGAPLSVVGNSSGYTFYSIGRNNADNASVISFRNSSSSTEYSWIESGVNSQLDFGTSGSYRMRITSAGNVGIGTSSPVSLLSLSSDNPIISLIRNDNASSARGAINFYATSILKWQIGTNEISGTAGFEFNFAGTNVALMNTSGSMGFGTNQLVGNITAAQVTPNMTASRSQIAITTGGNYGNVIGSGVEKYLDLSFYGFTNAEVARIRSWDESNVTLNGSLTFWTLPAGGSVTERMRITSAGFVGIGVIPQTWYSTVSVIQVSSGGALWGIGFSNNIFSANEYLDAAGTSKYIGADAASRYQQNAGAHVWSTAGAGGAGSSISFTERMRITSGGLILINTSVGTSTLNLKSQTNNKLITSYNPSGGDGTIYVYGTSTSLDYAFNTYSVGNAFYLYNNGNYSFAGSNVSDKRLKENIKNIDYNATEKLMQLVPKSYNMINHPDTKRSGFIAQEVKEILPDLITGTETNEEYLGLDYNGLLTLAVKAIQELKSENDTLKEILQRNNIQ